MVDEYNTGAYCRDCGGDSFGCVDCARDETLKLLASAIRKMLPSEELDRLVGLIDPDAPLRDFLAVLRNETSPPHAS